MFVLTLSEDRAPVIAEVDEAKYTLDKIDLRIDEEKVFQMVGSGICEFDDLCGFVSYSDSPSNKNPRCWRAKRIRFERLREKIIEAGYNHKD